MQKMRDKAIAVLAMFLLVIAILVTSVWVAVYADGDYKFYQSEYEKYNVTEPLNMEMGDVMEVTDYMMAYLIGQEEELSITTQVDGQEQDFFNEQDRLHMADVRNLFLGGIKVGIIAFVLAAVLVLFLKMKNKVRLSGIIPEAYNIALGIFVAIVVFLAIAFSIDFTRCFTIFHEIFFTNDLWLFDPATDYMIRMLPEGFFADMALRIGVTFVAGLVIVWAAFRIWRWVTLRKNYR